MQTQGILLSQAFEPPMEARLLSEKVLCVYFQPADSGPLLIDVSVMRMTQADACDRIQVRHGPIRGASVWRLVRSQSAAQLFAGALGHEHIVIRRIAGFRGIG